MVPKNKPCKRNNRQISDNTKIAAKQGNAEERPDAGCEIKRWKAAAEISTVSGVVACGRMLLITQMLVHLSFKQLLDSSCKQTLEFSLNIACAFALRHDELHKLHFLLA